MLCIFVIPYEMGQPIIIAEADGSKVTTVTTT